MAYSTDVEYVTAQQVSQYLGLVPPDAFTLTSDASSAQDQVEVALADLRKLSVGDKLRIYANDLAQSEYVEIDSFGSDHMVLTANLTQTYQTTESASIRLESAFHRESHPSREVVEDWIQDCQDQFDQITHHSWLGDGRQDIDRWFPFQPHFRRRYPLYYPMPFEPLDTYWMIQFPFRDIRTFDRTDKGDHLYVYTGSAEEDWLDPAYSKTESRTGDYWVDYKKGRLFFVGSRPMYTPKGVRMTYRFGGSEGVPRDVKRAVAHMVGIIYLEQEEYAVNLPGGDEAGTPNPADIIDRWQSDIDMIISRRRENLLYEGGA